MTVSTVIAPEYRLHSGFCFDDEPCLLPKLATKRCCTPVPDIIRRHSLIVAEYNACKLDEERLPFLLRHQDRFDIFLCKEVSLPIIRLTDEEFAMVENDFPAVISCHPFGTCYGQDEGVFALFEKLGFAVYEG